jgi:TolB-like protein/Tfp pilus assembly protein PilF
MTTQSRAVFLSYASEDAPAAQRIADGLRAAGIEVWFDREELRGGDAWDQKIRREIHECALFIPVVSANTTSRREGYFRLEWDLADQRSHRMARDQAFIVPVCLDATPGAGTDVPESFHRVQWTRLPGGEASPDFVARIKRLLSPESSTTARSLAGAASDSSPIPPTTARHVPFRRALPVAVTLAVLAALAYLLINKPWISKPAAPPTASNTTSSPVLPAAFAPPPHSIAVLPFVNIGGDRGQQYFSDGLTEELLNSLSRINDLQVSARTSSFSFQGEHPDIGTVARKLNVAAVLEGSVRRSAHTIRITVQLVNGATGFHLWSQTYDRGLGDVLALQTEIANAVAGALKITLLGDVAAKVELGGTHDPAAFDAYLRASKTLNEAHAAKDLQTAIDGFSEAIRLDHKYALAFTARADAFNELGGYWAAGVAATEQAFNRALADARMAIQLAPELGEAHGVLGYTFESLLDFMHANDEYQRAIALTAGDARVLAWYGDFAVSMGRSDAGLAALRHAVLLDPLNRERHWALGTGLRYARKYEAAITAYQDALALDPAYSQASVGRGVAQYALGDFKGARSSCETENREFRYYLVCLAITYDKLGRHTEAEVMLGKLRAQMGDADSYVYASIYAQWGDTASALRWLETAWRVRDSTLEYLRVDYMLDPLRNEPRFQAIERALKFPD